MHNTFNNNQIFKGIVPPPLPATFSSTLQNTSNITKASNQILPKDTSPSAPRSSVYKSTGNNEQKQQQLKS